MKPFTYQAYLWDPLIREQLEREVRRARSAAVGSLLARPFRALLASLRRKTSAVPALPLTTRRPAWMH